MHVVWMTSNGQVWFDFAKALNVARPAVVMLENVSSIVKHKHASKMDC